VEAAIALLGGSAPVLSIAVLMLAPGLAFAPLLPARAAASPVTALAAASALGFGATSVLLVTMSSFGVDLDGISVRIAIGVLVVAACAIPARERADREVGEGWAAAGLGIALLLGVLLQERVIGGSPVPGNDWAKYVLYADEIRESGSLLIDNPYWLLGVPFREDPGVPSVYGAFLAMTGQGAAVVAHGIWLFAVASILSIYALVRTLWGLRAGVIAALLWAVLPISQDILGWHGLANQAALALLPLVLLYAAEALGGQVDRRAVGGFALVVVAVFASHRLSAAVTVGALALTAIVAVPLRGAHVLRWGATAAGMAVVLGAGVAYDLYERNRTFDGSQGYEAYLSQKITWDLVARDFTYAFSAVAVLSALWLVYAAVRRRAELRDPVALVPIAALLVVVVGLGYAWVLHIPNAYVRMVYYLPLVAVPVVAVALVTLLPRRGPLVAAAALAAAVLSVSWGQAENVRSLYAFASPASVRGLDALEARLRPDEVVVTDRCWSFLATWLLHTRTLPALTPADIQPKAEVRLAEMGREIMSGSAEGRALADDLGVRYLVIDPTCRDEEREFLRPPLFADPLYASKRLVIATIRD